MPAQPKKKTEGNTGDDKVKEEVFPSTPKAPKSKPFSMVKKAQKEATAQSFTELAKKIATNVPANGCILMPPFEVTLLENFKGRSQDGIPFERQMFKIEFSAETGNRHIMNLKGSLWSYVCQLGIIAEKEGKHVRLLPKDTTDPFATREFDIV